MNEERIKKSTKRIFKAVFPDSTNHNHTLFSGTAMHLMHEVAFITATHYSRQKVITIKQNLLSAYTVTGNCIVWM